MKTRWKVVIIAILLAAIVILASLFYFWWASGDATIPMTPSAALTKTNVTDGVRFNIMSVTKTDIPWGEVRIYVTEGLHVRYWAPSDRDFPRLWTNTTVVLGNITLGDQVIGCEILDNGNGYIGMGDEFTVSGSWGIYLVTLFFEPTDGAMFQDSFHIR